MSPVVQAYGLPKVKTDPLPAGRRDTTPMAGPSPDALGAGADEALANLGGQAARITTGVAAGIWQQQQKDADQIAILGADGQLAAWENKRLYDPDNGALTVKGKDSFGLPEQVGDEFSQFSDQVAGGLTGDTQKLAFARAAAERKQNIDLTLRRHVFGEMQQYDTDETKAYVDTATQAAVANADDPRRVGLELNRAVTAVQDHATRNHIGPEQTQQQVAAVQTAIHKGVIDHFLSNDQDRAAQVYYEETKGQINGDSQAWIERALEEGTLRGESQRQSDAILAKTTTQDEAVTQAQQIADPKLRDEVQQRVLQSWSLKKQTDRDAAEQTMVDAANLIDANPVKGVQAIPPSMWMSMAVGQRTQLELYAKRNQGEGGVKTNLAAFDVLSRLATSPDPRDQADFAATPLVSKYRALLSDADLKHFIDIQGAIRKKDVSRVNILTASDTAQRQIVDQNLESIGLNPNPAAPGKSGYDKPTTDRVLSYRRAVRDAIAARESLPDAKKLTGPEVQDIADTLLAQTVKRQTHWFSTDEPSRFAFETPDKAVTDVGSIPQSERDLITSALKKNGRTVTDAAILSLFNQHLQQTRGR